MKNADLAQKPNTDIIGCRYQVSVLRDNFASMMLNALGAVDSSKVWAITEKTSTVYVGRQLHVVDCVKACFSHVYDESQPHVTMNAVFTKTSQEQEYSGSIADDGKLLNDIKKRFRVLARMSIYPLGEQDYEKSNHMMEETAANRKVKCAKGHFAVDMEGDVGDIFDVLNDILSYSNDKYKAYALNTSMTIYGPDAKEERA